MGYEGREATISAALSQQTESENPILVTHR
jgi:hypothetical protein